MSHTVKDAMKAVRHVLASLPEDHDRLVARLDGDADLSTDPAITLHRESDGRAHRVYVHVGETNISTETMTYETTDLGDGMAVHQVKGVTHGKIHARPGALFEADLSMALKAARNAFEPVAGPGDGTHPLTGEMVRATRLAVEAHNQFCDEDKALRLALNASGPVGDGNDVLTFVLPDGEALPFAVATGMGCVVRYDIESGDVLAKIERHRHEGLVGLGGMVADALHAALPSPPAP